MADVYDNVELAPVCEVSGPHKYLITISLYKNRGRWQHQFKVLQGKFVPKPESRIETAPKSVNQMVLKVLWEAIKNDELMFYELDEHGKKKFNNLQYHKPEEFLEKFKITCRYWGLEVS